MTICLLSKKRVNCGNKKRFKNNDILFGAMEASNAQSHTTLMEYMMFVFCEIYLLRIIRMHVFMSTI